MEMTLTNNLQREHDRVRAATSPELNERIDKDLERRIRFYSYQDKEAITERIHELDDEWDIERSLQANAATLSLLGVTMSIISGRKWLMLPMIVGGFLLHHSIKGWCPPLPAMRKMGMRTRSEIEQERYALKILRGDFDNLEREEGGQFKRDVSRLVKDLRSETLAV